MLRAPSGINFIGNFQLQFSEQGNTYNNVSVDSYMQRGFKRLPLAIVLNRTKCKYQHSTTKKFVNYQISKCQ